MNKLGLVPALLAASCATATPKFQKPTLPPTPTEACIERFQTVQQDVSEILNMLPDDCLGAKKRTSMANSMYDAARGECEKYTEELQTGMAAATTKAKLLRLTSAIEEGCKPE